MYTKGRSEWQLVIFTILTQMAVGGFVIWGLAAILIPTPNPFIAASLYSSAVLVVIMSALVLGTLVATLHLGRPLRAGFSITNFRSSWLSREALSGSCFGLLAFVLFVRRWLGRGFGSLDVFLILLGIVSGLILVFSISRLYMLRTVPAWNNWSTPAAFFTTCLLLGVVLTAILWVALIFFDDANNNFLLTNSLVSISTVLIFSLVSLQLFIFGMGIVYLNNQGGKAAASVQILWSKLRGTLTLRWVTALGGISILMVLLFVQLPPYFYIFSFALLLVSEILGRFLFYGFYQREGI
jgi:anaerobic dimethyl sulfoxide reductase subunit C (anchor subunit)